MIFLGFQALDINQIGSFKQHIANQENLSDVYYKENYENEKDLVYFPQNITEGYDIQRKIHDTKANYAKDAAKEQEQHKFNLTESETYKGRFQIKFPKN